MIIYNLIRDNRAQQCLENRMSSSAHKITIWKSFFSFLYFPLFYFFYLFNRIRVPCEKITFYLLAESPNTRRMHCIIYGNEDSEATLSHQANRLYVCVCVCGHELFSTFLIGRVWLCGNNNNRKIITSVTLFFVYFPIPFRCVFLFLSHFFMF